LDLFLLLLLFISFAFGLLLQVSLLSALLLFLLSPHLFGLSASDLVLLCLLASDLFLNVALPLLFESLPSGLIIATRSDRADGPNDRW